MANTNALVTAAMLASVYQNTGRDYLDLITPFFCSLLPARGQAIDFIFIQREMELRYGLAQVPIGVLNRIASKLARANPSICSSSRRGAFYVSNSYDTTDFLRDQQRTKQLCEDVTGSLQSHLREERNLPLEKDEVKRLLLQFLDQFGVDLLKNGAQIRSYVDEEKRNRYIACFIQKERQANSSVFDKVEELARGYMVYQCIYYFYSCEHESSAFRLDGVQLFVDTPLLIDALHFNTEENYCAINDILNLARSLGAEIKVFRHNVEEVSGILQAYIKAFPRVQTFGLFRLSTMGLVTISLIAEEIESRIKSVLGCEVIDAPGLGSSSDWDAIDSEEALLRYYKGRYRGISDVIGESRIENDIRSLRYALKQRDGRRPQRFEDSSVIILSNSRMAQRALGYLYTVLCPKEINLVYGVVEFSCLAWLSSPLINSEMAQDLLLYGATACLNATSAIINKMFEYLDALEGAEILDQHSAFVVRAHPSILRIAAEVTDNNVDSFTPDMLKKIYDLAIAEGAEEIAGKLYEPRIAQLEQENESIAQLNSDLKNEIHRRETHRKKQEEKVCARAQEHADKWKRNCEKGMMITASVLLVLIVLYSLYCILMATISGFSEKIQAYQYAALVLSLLGAIDWFYPKWKFIRRLVKAFSNKIADFVYDREVDQARRYIDIT